MKYKSKNINKCDFNSKGFNFNLIKFYFLVLSVSQFYILKLTYPILCG
jgi:hypothetical protein